MRDRGRMRGSEHLAGAVPAVKSFHGSGRGAQGDEFHVAVAGRGGDTCEEEVRETTVAGHDHNKHAHGPLLCRDGRDASRSCTACEGRGEDGERGEDGR